MKIRYISQLIINKIVTTDGFDDCTYHKHIAGNPAATLNESIVEIAFRLAEIQNNIEDTDTRTYRDTNTPKFAVGDAIFYLTLTKKIASDCVKEVIFQDGNFRYELSSIILAENEAFSSIYDLSIHQVKFWKNIYEEISGNNLKID